MALIFTVETGIADPDANSYCDVDVADDYISANVAQGTAWAALDDTTKQFHLVRASQYFDRIVKWDGQKVDQDSGLRWPRSGVYDEDGFEIADDEIPILLQYATAEFAAYLASGEDYTAAPGTRGFKQIQVDAINLKIDDNTMRGYVPDYVLEMLQVFGEVKKGTRPGFKKIVRT